MSIKRNPPRLVPLFRQPWTLAIRLAATKVFGAKKRVGFFLRVTVPFTFPAYLITSASPQARSWNQKRQMALASRT